MLLSAILSFSILFPVCAGWWKYRSTAPVLTPFIIALTIGLLNEILSFLLIKNHLPNAVNSNIYILIESLLLIWQFRNWGAFNTRPVWFWLILVILLSVWLAENLLFSGASPFSSYFRITYSFIITLLSISMINKTIIQEKRSLLKNPVFIICASFIIYYTYKVLTETFWLYGLGTSGSGKIFMNKIFRISVYINFLTNIIYGFAILWMPSKQRFTRQY